jgi:hypothetical protein
MHSDWLVLLDLFIHTLSVVLCHSSESYYRPSWTACVMFEISRQERPMTENFMFGLHTITVTECVKDDLS